MSYELDHAQVEAYHRDGYLHLPGFFDADEIQPLQKALAADPSVNGHLHHVHDGAGDTFGNTTDGYRLDYLGWYKEGGDWLGTCTRLERIIDGAAALIGEPVYHYHSKLVRKPRKDSGTLVWHQDYGGWYQDGCLRPDMLTFVLAVSDADDHSGCLRLLKGSHKLGRVDRIRGEFTYTNINPVRLQAMLSRFEEVAAEMREGDGLFFHGNLVHSSGPNNADYDRWLLELSYNGTSNAPVFDNQTHHAVKSMQVARDEALREGEFSGVFDHTPLQDVTNRNAEGASIYFRDEFPDLS